MTMTDENTAASVHERVGWNHPVQIVREFVQDHLLEPDALRGSEQFLGSFDGDGNRIDVQNDEQARHDRLTQASVQPVLETGNMAQMLQNLTPQQINTLRQQLGMPVNQPNTTPAPAVPQAQLESMRQDTSRTADEIVSLRQQLDAVQAQLRNLAENGPAASSPVPTMPAPTPGDNTLAPSNGDTNTQV